ncbi:MAG: hypothetical protein CSB55_05245 [Candidatus Cloacimonadota bacterium]|nr:MAG: hypothetical protein CSB55_05245 [Candidatus Cloacimonadota bacterium]
MLRYFIAEVKKKILSLIGSEKIKNKIRYYYNYKTFKEAEKLEKKIKRLAEESTESGISGKDDNLIVSMTTFGKRTDKVYLTVETLFRQSVKADKIILWLAKDEFNPNNIPESLKRCIKRGLTVDFCKNIRSYKKLIPTLRKYSGYKIVTVDDDVFYPENFLEDFVKAYEDDPGSVYCTRARKIHSDRDYEYWENIIEPERGLDVMPIGCGGVFYPPEVFHEDILKENLFWEMARFGDDIWFKAMTLLNNYPCKLIKKQKDFPIVPDTQNYALWDDNFSGRNDKQIKKVFDYYNLWEKFK